MDYFMMSVNGQRIIIYKELITKYLRKGDIEQLGIKKK